MKTALFAFAILLLGSFALPPAAASPEPPQCAPPGCPTQPPVDVCVSKDTDGCYNDNWICVTFSRQVPQCLDHPCDDPRIDCAVTCAPETCNPCGTTIHCELPPVPQPCEPPYFGCTPAPLPVQLNSAPPIPPVYVCVEGVTHASCWNGGTVCVGFSYQIPQCVTAGVVCAPETCSPCSKLAICDIIADPDLVDVCIAGTTDPSCYGFHDVCIEVSDMVPFCRDLDVECTEACNPCMQINCDIFQSSGPEPMCMYYYYEIDLGAVRYVQRDSCHSEIWVNGERIK